MRSKEMSTTFIYSAWAYWKRGLTLIGLGGADSAPPPKVFLYNFFFGDPSLSDERNHASH